MSSSSDFCSPCSVLHKHIHAVDFCLVCKELLCGDCTTHHKALKATSHHKIVEKTIGLSISEEQDDKKCEYHKTNDVTHFCIDHQTLCCTECLVNDHRGCSNIITLESASQNAKCSAYFDECESDLLNIQTSYSELLNAEKNNENNVQEVVQKIKQAISVRKTELLEKVSTLADSALVDIDAVANSTMTDIKITKDSFANELNEVNHQLKTLQMIKEFGTDEQTFLQCHNLNKFRNQCNEALVKSTENFKRYRVEISDATHASLDERFGSVSIKIETTQLKVGKPHTRTAQTESIGESTKRTYVIACVHLQNVSTKGVCITSFALTDEDIFIFVRFNIVGASKAYYYRGGEFLGHTKLKSSPYDIAVLPNSKTAIITMGTSSNYLQIVDLSSKRVIKTIEVSYVVYGVDARNDVIAIGSGSNINFIDIGGNILKTIPVIKGNVRYLKLGQRNEVYYISGNVLFSIDENGVTKELYTCEDGFRCPKIELDATGCIYFTKKKSDSVYRLTTGIESVNIETAIEDTSIAKPYMIRFNSQQTKFFVSDDKCMLGVYSCIGC